VWGAGLLASILAFFGLLSGSAQSTRGGARAVPSQQQPLLVQVRLTGTSTRIPPSFLGLGVEVSELESYARARGVFGRAVSLLRPGSERSMPLRVGGYSADEAYWDTSPRSAPSGVFEVGHNWVRQLAGLARRAQLRVSLAVNLAVHSPSMAAGFARAVSRALAPGRLAGVAVGDEPDLYGREPWFDSERVASTLSSTPHGWTASYSPRSYRRDYVAYAHALAAAVPGISFSGPEAAGLGSSWLHALAGLGRLGPTALTVHRYPLSCRPPNSPIYPQISTLLAESSSTGLAQRLRPAIAFAHQAGMSLVVSEINSASCAGPPGVTNSFATALWAPDVLFELIRAGVNGVYWHVRANRLNSPFQLQASAIEPAPELYGLALFAQMLKPRARLVTPEVTTAAPGAEVKVWAVRSRGGTSVLVINEGPQPASAALNLGRGLGAARVERLLAPSVTSTTGVTLAGRSIGADARWHGPQQFATARPQDGTYQLSVPGYSAALLQTQAP
jgi:hypothetical protein